MSNNPLVGIAEIPPFDQIAPEHVEPGIRTLLEAMQKGIEEIESSTESDWNLVERLADLSEPLRAGWGAVNHLMSVKNSPELREAHQTVEGDVVSAWMRVAQSGAVYDGLKALKESSAWSSLTETQHRIVNKMMLEAELAGIALDDEKRARFNEIQRELSEVGTKYSNNVLDATKAWKLVLTEKEDVAGLPKMQLNMAAAAAKQAGHKNATPEDGPWLITLDMPSVLPFFKHAKHREHREKVYRAYISRASSGEWNNRPLIDQIIKLRRETAELLGYNSYAEMSLAQKMAPGVEAVGELAQEVFSASKEAAVQDLEEMREMARSGIEGIPDDGDLKHWDLYFAAERMREQKFQFTDDDVRPYFPLERVLDGLFGVVHRLFGVTCEPADGEVPIWNDDVRFFRVNDESGDSIAAFYLDPYSRPENKRGGAWMDECVVRRRKAASEAVRLPIAYLVCNQTPPVGDTPSLMTFNEVRTLFHEFGHGLQHMLTEVDYLQASGINGIEWDAVEIASQFMENWCYHRETLIGMSGHYETGESLPDELFEKIVAAKNFQKGRGYLRQIAFGLTDLELYHQYDPESGETPFDVYRRIGNQYLEMPIFEDDYFLCFFQHIFPWGYAAGYFSYLWSEVLAADCFGAFEEVGLDNEAGVRETGMRYRKTLLALGGGRHPMDVFKDFRGREPNTEALLRHNGLN